MKIKLIKEMGKEPVGAELYARNQEQADYLVEQGFAEHLPDDELKEKKLVLINPAPGVWTTVWQDAETKQEPVAVVETANQQTGETQTTAVASTGTVTKKAAKDVIDAIKSAKTLAELSAAFANDDRTTVIQAFEDKKTEFPE